MVEWRALQVGQNRTVLHKSIQDINTSYLLLQKVWKNIGRSQNTSKALTKIVLLKGRQPKNVQQAKATLARKFISGEMFRIFLFYSKQYI